jgi:predicted transcriptional regulator
MKPRAGIVGPSDSVHLISEIAAEYNDRLLPIPFIYQNTEEATNILKQNQSRVEVWVFAGPALYNPAKKSGSKQPFYYLHLDGASLTKTLVEIGYKDGSCLERISIDMLTERDVYETYRDLCIPSDQVYVHEYSYDTPLEDLLVFHRKLFKDGKVDICITCLYSIYEQLQSLGIPAYWVTPTRSNIRETLSTAIQQWETLHFKQSQIAALLVKVEKMEKKTDYNMVSYDLHRLNLEIQSAVLNFSESISGSFMTLGVGTFIIFSTRGSLQETGQQVGSLLEKLSFITESPSNVGIGYGETALTAEENARLALNHAQNYDAFCAFLVDDRGTIEGPLKEQENISFGFRNENKEISEKLKQSGVTITTFNKILSVQKKMGNHSITAANIAEWLKMTPRNANRILNSLVEQGIAEIIGEEAPTSKGRPRKVYRVSFEQGIKDE